MPTPYDAALQGEHCAGPKSMQDLLLEGDARYDIDMLNPSLIDLQLQGRTVMGKAKQETYVHFHSVPMKPVQPINSSAPQV